MKELKDGIRSLVRIHFKGHVHKQFRGTDSDKRFANEVKVLKVLEERGCENVPRLLEHDPETLTIVTTNCGAPAPLITKEKATALFNELEELYGVRHDDPEPRNVTYSAHQGRFCLIDFELSEVLPEPVKPSSKGKVLRAAWSALSKRGKYHAANDDAYIAFTVNPEKTLHLEDSGEILLDPSHLVLAVSDGMGGKNAGEFASRLLMSRIRKEADRLYQILTDKDGAEEALDQLLRNAHHDLIDLAQKGGNAEGMGATFTMAWITHQRLYWAHIGDSRLYYVRDGSVVQLTKDDCRAWHEWNRGLITEYSYRNHPRKSILSDVLGGSIHEPSPQVGFIELELNQKIMLCTDGIMDGLWEKSIREELLEERSIAKTARALCSRAYENDDRDDTTLIVAKISRV
ncbi:protein phosphatase 2C domain-containing protein [Akkermansiaceae bacterium]|nr:protein phosphatase 2C domain-containing protein [Akkermansiaceae bacterium]